jgi:hypothetical protein
MVKAEMLRYEAIKEILPECMKTRVDEMESGFKDVIKQLAVEIVRDNTCKNEEETKKDTKKIDVDFEN